jgi:hypothetical protein
MKRLEFCPLRAPHHPREVFVLALDSESNGVFFGVTVWQTEQWPDTARVGSAISSAQPVRDTLPLVSEHSHGPGGAMACPRCRDGELAREAAFGRLMRALPPGSPPMFKRPEFVGRPFGTPPPPVDDDEWAGWDSDR